MTPWLQDADVTLYHGDVLSTLRELPASSVDCVVTSPPYWGLRDYGTGEWEGGDAGCDHKAPPKGGPHTASTLGPKRDGLGPGNAAWTDSKRNHQFTETCSKCGATRIDQQLGLEPTPEQYVERMVEVFREVRRVLAEHGTVWLNLGDSYYAAGWESRRRNEVGAGSFDPADRRSHTGIVDGLKIKDLVGIPWRTAFALQADGWYLRSDIIWSKPNPMPESVTDRPTKAHEYVFLLSKQPRYYFDQEAVREPHISNGRGGFSNKETLKSVRHQQAHAPSLVNAEVHPNGRNIRSVWEIPTQPYPEAHFATFPEELARRCIAAGCPEDGIVLDPFVGSGTVCYVARKLGRRAVGIDLSESYLRLAARRLQQQSLFAEAASGL